MCASWTLARTAVGTLALIVPLACGKLPRSEGWENHRWFDCVQVAGTAEAPELLVVWDGTGPLRSRLSDTLQFALWSDGRAIWRHGDLFEPASYREFRVDAEEVDRLGALVVERTRGAVLAGPQTACSSEQLILWRRSGKLAGVRSEAFLEQLGLPASGFGRVGVEVSAESEAEIERVGAKWGFRGEELDAVRSRLAIERALGALVAAHPDARVVTGVSLASP